MSESFAHTRLPENVTTFALARRPEHVRQPIGQPMCAAAVLRMMLLYITKGTAPIPSVRELYEMGCTFNGKRFFRSKRGLRMAAIESVARQLNFSTQSGQVGSIELLRATTDREDTPVYCVINFVVPHAVMVVSVTDTHVHFLDPDVDNTSAEIMGIEEFMETWGVYNRQYLIVRNSKTN